MKKDEEELLLSIEADATILVGELGVVLKENPIIRDALTNNTTIPSYVNRIANSLDRLRNKRVVSSDRDSFESVVKRNIEEVFDDDEVDIHRLTANIMYDLKKDGYQFVKVNTDKHNQENGTGYMALVPEEPDEEMIKAAATVLVKMDISQTPYTEIAKKVWKAMVEAT